MFERSGDDRAHDLWGSSKPSSKVREGVEIFGIFGRVPSGSPLHAQDPGGIFGTFMETREGPGIFGIFEAGAFGTRGSSGSSAARMPGNVRIIGIVVPPDAWAEPERRTGTTASRLLAKQNHGVI